ncbi:MAG: rhomboid family intramembrane serine protease [bacterium]|nr:rhomboid family intramembrane serine protease [bacterium]
MIPLRDENPGLRFPVVTVLLVAANVAVFVYQTLLDPRQQTVFIMSYGMVPAQLLGQAPRLYGGFPSALTLVTSQFLHGGILHLAGNMLYLWIFGNNIEDVLGKFKFLLFYLLCGTFAAIAHVIINPFSTVPMVGASGAIAGILGAYLVTFPGARVLVLIFLVIFVTTARIPAFWVLGFWFVMQVLYATTSAAGETSVAYLAHVGGFLAGIYLMKKLRPGVGWGRGRR